MPSPFNDTTSQNINSMSGGPLSSMGLTALDSLGGYKMPEFNTPNMGGGLQSSNNAFQAASATNPFSSGRVGTEAASSLGGGGGALSAAASKLSQAASALLQAAARLGGGGMAGTMQMPSALGGYGGGMGTAQEELSQQASLINRNPFARAGHERTKDGGGGGGAGGGKKDPLKAGSGGRTFEDLFVSTANTLSNLPFGVGFIASAPMLAYASTRNITRQYNAIANAPNLQSALRAIPFYSGTNADALDRLQDVGNTIQGIEYPAFQTTSIMGMEGIANDATFIDLLQPTARIRGKNGIFTVNSKAGSVGSFNVLGYMGQNLGLGPGSAMGQIRDLLNNVGYRELMDPTGNVITASGSLQRGIGGSFETLRGTLAGGVRISDLVNFQTAGLDPTQIGQAFSANLSSSNLLGLFNNPNNANITSAAGGRILRNVNALNLTGSAASALIGNYLQLGQQLGTFGYEMGDSFGAGTLGLIGRMQTQDQYGIFKDVNAPAAAGRIDLKMGKGAVQAFQQNFAGIGNRILQAHAIRVAGMSGAQGFLEQLSSFDARQILVDRLGARRAQYAMSGMNLSMPEQDVLSMGPADLPERDPSAPGKGQFAVRRTMAAADLGKVKDVMDNQLTQLTKLVEINAAMEKHLRRQASPTAAVTSVQGGGLNDFIQFINDQIKTINSASRYINIPLLPTAAPIKVPGAAPAPATGPNP